ncbi:hypothetical protein ACX1DX_09225 [Tessaracoccus sp. Y36]
MKVTTLTADSASRLAVETLGLDPDAVGLPSAECVAASLRRAASFMCPTSPSRLVDAVLGALRPIHPNDLRRDEVVDVLDQLIASGDLLELRLERDRSTRLLYLAPPSFIERAPGSYLLLGARPFGAPIISDELAAAIEYEGHTRVLTLDAADCETDLRSHGLQPVPRERWVASPSAEPPTDLVERHRARLTLAPEAGELSGLQLLDPAAKVGYYRGRWRSPAATDTGDYVARRPQSYGADLWCLVRFEAGQPIRLMEFPLTDPWLPGRDEAWRYQAAVDAMRGTPQQFRIRPGAREDAILDFFSPLPGFAERYVQLAGLTLGKTPGALFSFRLLPRAGDDVTKFLNNMLWMTYKEESSDDSNANHRGDDR